MKNYMTICLFLSSLIILTSCVPENGQKAKEKVGDFASVEREENPETSPQQLTNPRNEEIPSFSQNIDEENISQNVQKALPKKVEAPKEKLAPINVEAPKKEEAPKTSEKTEASSPNSIQPERPSEVKAIPVCPTGTKHKGLSDLVFGRVMCRVYCEDHGMKEPGGAGWTIARKLLSEYYGEPMSHDQSDIDKRERMALCANLVHKDFQDNAEKYSCKNGSQVIEEESNNPRYPKQFRCEKKSVKMWEMNVKCDGEFQTSTISKILKQSTDEYSNPYFGYCQTWELKDLGKQYQPVERWSCPTGYKVVLNAWKNAKCVRN